MTRKSDSKAHCRSCTGAAEATPEWSYLQRGQYGLQWNPQEDRKILRILETPFQPSYKNIKTSKGVAKRLVIVIDNCMGQQTSEWNQCFMTESQRSQCFPLLQNEDINKALSGNPADRLFFIAISRQEFQQYTVLGKLGIHRDFVLRQSSFMSLHAQSKM